MTTVTESKPEQHPVLTRLKSELAITQQQLDVLGEYFLLALKQLPKGTLTVSLTEQAQLGELPFALQAKSDKSGNIIFRAVEAK